MSPAPQTPAPAQPEAPPRPPLRDRLFRPRALVVAAGLVALPVLGPWLLRQVPNLTDRSEYQIPFAQLQLKPAPPAEIPADFLEQVRQRARMHDQLSVLDPELPRLLAEAFSRHPWVENVVSVHNVFPATVSIELTYRRPVALVQVEDGFYAVDSKGSLLPPQDFDESALEKYVPVLGIHSRPQKAAGRLWNDPAVLGAAQLADFLGVRWKSLGLSAIEVSSGSGADASLEHLTFTLRTQEGSRILWGRVPGSSHPGELAAHQKLGRLEKYLAEFGNFKHPHGPYEIDIRHWQDISRRQLENPHANTARRPDRGAGPR